MRASKPTKNLKQTLSHQLISIGFIICMIIFMALGILLPRTLMPVYENNIYQYLKQPLELIDYEIDSSQVNSTVAYLYVTGDNEIIASDNLSKVISANPEQVLRFIDKGYGKFKFLGATYYYNTSYNQYVTKISITDDSYILQMKKDILYTIFPIILITVLLIAALLIFWSRRLVLKIEHLKEKVDNLSNDNYKDGYRYGDDDELMALSNAIDNMHLKLKEEEEYKNQMYQNISHDFKTPLTVIKSYIEAIEDGVQAPADGFEIIKQQVDKLELKVHSLLYLNKLNYIKDSKNYKEEHIDIVKVIRKSVDKFKVIAPQLSWKIELKDKNTIYRGSEDMWEAVIDNMLQNFIRYAEHEVKITLKKNTLQLYNDGPNIDPNILNDIFTPYKKGINGQFGLGLSIVKKTLALCNYEISVKNEKKGVSFMIK